MFVSNQFNILQEVSLKKTIFSDKSPIVFIHPAKTGGTNINYLIRLILNSKKLGYYTISPKCDKVPINIVTEGCLAGLQVIKSRPNFFDLRSKPYIQYIGEHLPLPSYDYFKVSMNYIAIVREPVDRMLSLGNYLYQEGRAQINEIESLLLTKEVDNLQTRWIAGEIYMSGPCTDKTFAQALQNIQKIFRIVAPTDDINTVLSLIANYFGVHDIAIPKINVTKEKFLTKKDTELCQKILERNQYDQKLYEYVKLHWEFWKKEHIETIQDNISVDKDYWVMSPTLHGSVFSKTDNITYLKLEDITMLGLSQEGELTSLPWNA